MRERCQRVPEIAEKEAKEISAKPTCISAVACDRSAASGVVRDGIYQRKIIALHTAAIGLKWFSSPRLETRTKESNICASTGATNPGA